MSYKCMHLCGVFASGRGLDAAHYIDAPGSQRGNRFRYVLGRQSARCDQARARRFVLKECFAGSGPIESLSSAADGRCRARIDQDRVDIGIGNASFRG